MSNYQAIIAKIDRTIPIDGADNIKIAVVLSEFVIVSKSYVDGMVGVFFPAGTQLSESFCRENNLYRDKEQNKDNTKSGFIEKNRKIRAQPFMKVKSEGLFMSLDALSFTGAKLTDLRVGDKFEKLNNIDIATKFISEKTKNAGAANKQKAVKKNLTPLFHEHMDTGQLKHNITKIEVGDLITIQTKKHGTSVRYANTKHQLALPKWKKFVNKFFDVFPTEKFDFVVGTRRVVLNTPEKTGFHGSEAYRFVWLEKLKPFLTQGMTVYGELVGFANGKPIMNPHNLDSLKNKALLKKYGKEPMVYKYGCPNGTCDFHIYRITVTTNDGLTIDLSQKQLVTWCELRGFKPSHDLVEPFFYDGNADALLELVETLTEREDVLCEDVHDASHISEGVIIRVDRGGFNPLFLKNKSFYFKCLEGIAQENEVDEEDAS
ncbi:putative RNA ligase [Alishewanella phage vB_AspM_Slickus01]|nr:putative RNA ligase [Alishewanella phage vB_AspM_Slickus01]